MSGAELVRNTDQKFCLAFQVEFSIRMVKIMHMDFSEMNKDGTLTSYLSEFEDQKFYLIPLFQ